MNEMRSKELLLATGPAAGKKRAVVVRLSLPSLAGYGNKQCGWIADYRQTSSERIWGAGHSFVTK